MLKKTLLETLGKGTEILENGVSKLNANIHKIAETTLEKKYDFAVVTSSFEKLIGCQTAFDLAKDISKEILECSIDEDEIYDKDFIELLSDLDDKKVVILTDNYEVINHLKSEFPKIEIFNYENLKLIKSKEDFANSSKYLINYSKKKIKEKFTSNK
ncbi:MAG: hypothetical protein RSB67_04120 [Clostridia bacterium]